jgi:hypothetical protein
MVYVKWFLPKHVYPVETEVHEDHLAAFLRFVIDQDGTIMEVH